MKISKILTMPRIIGLALITASLLAFAYRKAGIATTIISIAGLVLLTAGNRSAGKNWKILAESFRNAKTPIIAAIDFSFWILFLGLSLATRNILRPAYEQMKAIDLENAGIDAVPGINDTISRFLTTTITGIIILWLAAILIYSISRGLIWATITGKKTGTGFFAKLSLLNLAWCTAWLLLAFWLSIGSIPELNAAIIIIAAVIYTHLTTVMHRTFAEKRLALQSLKEAFATGFGKISIFFQPYAYIIAVYAVLSLMLSILLATTAKWLPYTLQIIVMFIIYLLLIAWYRTYIHLVMRHKG